MFDPYVVIGGLLSDGLAVVVQLTFLIVALTTVRKSRPDAAGLIVASAAVLLCAALLSPVLTALIPFFLQSASATTFGTVYTVVRIALSIVSAAGWALLIVGIVRLASPHGERRVDPTRFS